MKKLVVYYSYEGNTKCIADSIGNAVGADMLELKVINENKSKGFKKYLWGAKQVFSKKMPEISTIDKDPSQYDIIYIGSPVWAYTYAPAVKSFLSRVNIKGKKVALFCCHGGGKGKTFKNLKGDMGENTYVGEIDFKEPLKNDREKDIQRAKEWAISMSSK